MLQGRALAYVQRAACRHAEQASVTRGVGVLHVAELAVESHVLEGERPLHQEEVAAVEAAGYGGCALDEGVGGGCDRDVVAGGDGDGAGLRDGAIIEHLDGIGGGAARDELGERLAHAGEGLARARDSADDAGADVGRGLAGAGYVHAVVNVEAGRLVGAPVVLHSPDVLLDRIAGVAARQVGDGDLPIVGLGDAEEPGRGVWIRVTRDLVARGTQLRRLARRAIAGEHDAGRGARVASLPDLVDLEVAHQLVGVGVVAPLLLQREVGCRRAEGHDHLAGRRLERALGDVARVEKVRVGGGTVDDGVAAVLVGSARVA